MTQEEKDLILKDLCSRLPYGVIGEYSWKGNKPYNKELTGNLYDELNSSWSSTEDSKFIPYLRPMSSMTKEEKEELSHLLPKNWSIEIDKLNNLYFDMCTTVFLEIDAILDILNWLLSRHFDYRGLIEKGLAIAVTE